MARQLTADRLAARLAKLGGARLSAEEYGAGDDLLGDDDSGNGQPAPIHDAAGRVDMEKLLCDLLRALGVELPEGTDAKAFKQELYAAAMRAISERTGKGKRPGGTSSAGASGNPLIPGGGGGEVEPMYMSLSTIEQLADPTAKQIALSLAVECDRLNHDRREVARSARRQQEAQLGEASSKRQAIVNRILAANPFVVREVEALLNGMDNRGMAFSNEATTALMALERRVNQQLATDRQPAA